MRTVKVGESDANLTRVYFDIMLLDGKTPAVGEAGFQPLLSQNGNGFATPGIGVLIAIGFGKYYAQLDPAFITTPGDVLQTVYQRSGITTIAYGDSLQVIDSSTILPANQATTVIYYGSIVEANLYFSQRLNTELWVNASDTDKVKALQTATDAIDRLSYAGDKMDVSQILQFPRRNDYTNQDDSLTSTFDTLVPQDIVNACYLIAYKILDGWDPDMEIANLSAVQQGYGQSKTIYDRSRIPEYISAGIPSATAWSYLRPYLRDPRKVILSRIS